jgi:hypothetical protein
MVAEGVVALTQVTPIVGRRTKIIVQCAVQIVVRSMPVVRITRDAKPSSSFVRENVEVLAEAQDKARHRL